MVETVVKTIVEGKALGKPNPKAVAGVKPKYAHCGIILLQQILRDITGLKTMISPLREQV